MKALIPLVIPIACVWFVFDCALSRAFQEWRRLVSVMAAGGFLTGFGGGLALTAARAGDDPFTVGRLAAAVMFLSLSGASVHLLYRNAGVGFAFLLPNRLLGQRVRCAGFALTTGVVLGLLAVLVLPSREISALLVLAIVGSLFPFLASAIEPRLSARLSFSSYSLMLFLTSLVLYAGSLSPRLNLFAPLSMKLMKFIHDFVHQFFESMLIPDHLFFTTAAWDYIGFLFGNRVGFWGGLIIWFVPAVLITLGMGREPLPSVAHIRQGAQRRKLLAGYLRGRRDRTIIPLISVAILTLAVYRSLNPVVEYWDPKPLPVAAGSNGEIVIPAQGEGYDLDDGKLHKFTTRQGDKDVRFFVIRKPDGKLAVTLDACAICQPEGYGQGDGTVICYYCKTLIPLETVGQVGGCNPVPVPFREEPGAVRVAAGELLSLWNSNVQGSKNVPERGK